ncbi:MAG: hypothetical protein V4627_15135 [Pseudomonadota bacterium]
MKIRLTRSESGLVTALTLAIALACLGPAVAQYADYHAFADQRTLWGLPFAMDVLSNLPFALFGVWGLVRLCSTDAPRPRAVFVTEETQRDLSKLFFTGLILTALCSTWYHLQPDDSGLAIDRLGMLMAFAGLLGLAAIDRISDRAGAWMAATVLTLGPIAVGVWAMTGNLLPWSVLQGGGMLLVVVMALRKPRVGAWVIPLGEVIAWYALAKLLELGDHHILAWTDGLVSGHTLKHMAAAMAAWPVIAVMQNGAYSGGTRFWLATAERT